MKKVLIICAAGISSFLMAKKASEYFQTNGEATVVKAASVIAGAKAISVDEHDIYLVSPQTRQYFEELSKAALKQNKPIEMLPAQAYVPNEKGIEILCALIQKIS